MNLVMSQVSINKIDRKVQTFRDQFKLKMNLNQPINKNRTHFLIYVVLEVQSTIAGHVLRLSIFQEFEYLNSIFSTCLRLSDCMLINRVYRLFIMIDFELILSESLSICLHLVL
jgi:hypothetical protein